MRNEKIGDMYVNKTVVIISGFARTFHGPTPIPEKIRLHRVKFHLRPPYVPTISEGSVSEA